MREPPNARIGLFLTLLTLAACGEADGPAGLEEQFLAGPGQFAVVNPGIEGDLDTDLIVNGARAVADGVGLHDLVAGNITVTVPGGATIRSAILYWGARWDFADPPSVDLSMIEVTVGATTADIEGAYIGTEVIIPGNDSHSWRADLIGEGFSFAPGLNTVSLVVPDDGVPDAGIDGASLVVTYDDGTAGSVELRDGNDFAYEPRGLETQEQTFSFPASPADRTATLLLVVGDVEGSRPTRIEITSGGVGDQELQNKLGEFGDSCGRDGAQWDTCAIDVLVPAGSTELSAQLFSWDDPTEKEPASLYWVLGALELEDPPTPGVCDGLTPGYWQNWSNHYTEAEFQQLLDWVNDHDYRVVALSISEITAILGYGGPDAIQRLEKFYYANLLTLALTGHPGLPNPDTASLTDDCTHPDSEATLGEALDVAEDIFANPGDYRRGQINGVKDILDKIANLND